MRSLATLLLLTLFTASLGEDPVSGEDIDDLAEEDRDMRKAMESPREPEPDPSELRPGEQKMTFIPPQLTEEEQNEVFLPKNMRCDGCLAIAAQWHRAFKKSHVHKSPEWRMSEGAVIAALGRKEAL